MVSRTSNRMASQHSFAMIPRSDIPRSRYKLMQDMKTTFNGGDLIPIYCEEMVPGDQFNGEMSVFARMATPIVPVLDNAEMETFFFFVPNRIVWDSWEEFISGTEDKLVPVVRSGANGFTPLGLFDQFGIPPSNQTEPAYTIEVSALPARAYNKIYNEWFRDQNLMPEAVENTDDGPDAESEYPIRKRAKKHDYFTSMLPWPQKGTAVQLPLGTEAPVIADVSDPRPVVGMDSSTWPGPVLWSHLRGQNSDNDVSFYAGNPDPGGVIRWHPTATGLVTDLSAATAATINAIRTAFQVQRMLERDARGGSRYIEQIQSHFGVRPPDYRLQRPEYIGGGKTRVTTHPIAQTSETNETPQGNLAAFTTAQGGRHKFNYSATEHGYIIGVANVRTDITYQQGLRRHWSRKTRYDFYFPVFAHLGEQPVLLKELYLRGPEGGDETVIGYQERWAEYRYTPNEIKAQFRSTYSQPLDMWHYSQRFNNAPELNASFITDASQEVLARSMAVGVEANGQQILLDALFEVYATRPMPTYSVPGLIDHF